MDRRNLYFYEPCKTDVESMPSFTLAPPFLFSCHQVPAAGRGGRGADLSKEEVGVCKSGIPPVTILVIIHQKNNYLNIKSELKKSIYLTGIN